MQTRVGHLQLNVAPGNLGFYRELSALLGLSTIYQDDGMLGVGAADGGSLWFAGLAKEVANDYDGPGMNHLGLGVGALADVDAVAAWLTERGVPRLFETPRHRPEFTDGSSSYYQVMFESPDRILFEVVYTGPSGAA
jgi:catechol 2,3-dioxygenase-like lactoylglutathione lyase family enzyme